MSRPLRRWQVGNTLRHHGKLHHPDSKVERLWIRLLSSCISLPFTARDVHKIPPTGLVRDPHPAGVPQSGPGKGSHASQTKVKLFASSCPYLMICLWWIMRCCPNTKQTIIATLSPGHVPTGIRNSASSHFSLSAAVWMSQPPPFPRRLTIRG